MDEIKKIPEAENNEELKEQETPTSENVDVSATEVDVTAPKASISKLPLIIGGVVAGIATIAVSIAIILGSGNGDQSEFESTVDNGHEHNYSEWVVVDKPSCTETGTEERSCECGEKETRPVTPIAHAYDDKYDEDCNVCGYTRAVECAHTETVVISGKDASCTATGLTDGTKCVKCGLTIEAQHTIQMVDHTYDNKYDEDCNVCGHTRDAECAHVETVVIPGKAATCTTTGITDGTKCVKCGVVIVTQTTIPIVAHIEISVSAVEATCTKTGLTAGIKCSVCNKTLVVQQETPKIAHTYDDKYDDSCNICGYIRDAECAHREIEILHGYDATCIATGLTDGKKCKKCGEIITEQTIILVKSHSEVTDSAVQATCTSTGLTEGKHCSVCSKVLVAQDTVATIPHTEVIDPAVSATCTASGLTEGKHCSKCLTVIVAQTTVKALGHTEVVDPAVSATCTSTGLTEGKHCSVCLKTIVSQSIVSIKPHTEVVDAAVEATCTSTGLTEGKHCSICSKTIVAQTIISIVPHTEILDEAVEATCTSEGLTEGKHCSVCSKVIVAQQETAKVSHTYDDKYDDTCNKCGFVRDAECAHKETETVYGYSATCTSSGLTNGTKCKKCGTTIVEQKIISAIGHKYNSGIIVVEPTCVSAGTKKYTCTISGCNNSYTESIALQSYSATEIFEQSVKYVGEIVVYDKNGSELGLGTCFVYSSDGKIITNYHVIDEAYSAIVTINGVKYEVKQILAYDENIDLAVLKIDATNLPFANVCKLPVKTGETVYAIGSSRGLTNTYSKGIITYADRVVDGVSHIQHDASITHGNSGGPLINIYGEVIGVNTWGLTDSQNLNFAVFTSEIDNLTYLKTPITIKDFYEENNTAYQILRNWVFENYNYTGESYIEYTYKLSGEIYSTYSLIYYINTESLYLMYSYVFSNNDNRFVSVELSEDVSALWYYASYTDGDYSYQKNITMGYIFPSTFTRDGSLGYYSSEGDYWTMSSLLGTYQSGIAYALDWLDWMATYYNIGVNIKDFGFEVFGKNETVKTPHEILVDGIVENGVYNSDSDWYQIVEAGEFTGYSMQFILTYHQSDDMVSAFMTIQFDEGYRYVIYFVLKPEPEGMYYICQLDDKKADGTFEQLNKIVGYIDPLSFSEDSSLTYTSYEGENPDDLLEAYSVLIVKLIDWVDYCLESRSINTSISQLGF